MTKKEFKRLTKDQLVELYKESDYNFTRLDKHLGFKKDYSRKVFKRMGIDYNKLKKEQEEKLKSEYLSNPKLCLHCGKPLPFENRNNKYCCLSCSISENNKGLVRNKSGNNGKPKTLDHTKNKKPKTHLENNNSNTKNDKDNKEPKVCLNCGRVLNHNGLFCDSRCQGEYKHKKCYEDFLNNNDKYCNGGYTPKGFKNEFLAEQGNVCAICGCTPMWNGKPLTFVLDHIDGDASNNKRENLRMICPNCDSQLPTFKSKNKHSTRRNYWKEKIIRNMNNNSDDNNKPII